MVNRIYDLADKIYFTTCRSKQIFASEEALEPKRRNGNILSISEPIMKKSIWCKIGIHDLCPKICDCSCHDYVRDTKL